jgi:branched-chain amino acid transport system substrate-binding protein
VIARRASGLLAAAIAALVSSCGGGDDESLRIGVLADCEGAVGGLYDISLGGAELPLLRRGARLVGTRPSEGVDGLTIGSRDVELVFGCAGEQTAGAAELRRLVESEKAEIVVGPNFVPLGLVTTEYARHQPDVTFVVTSLEVLTHLRPGPNVFRFNLGFAQGTAGLASHAFHRLGWRRAVTLAERNPAGFGFQAAAVAEFCALGGRISERVWLDLDPERMRAQLARAARLDVDGFFVLTTGPDAGVFLELLAKERSRLSTAAVFSAGSLTGLDASLAARLGSGLVGAVAVWDWPGPMLPSAVRYIEDYRRALPQAADAADASFHLFDVYYRNGMEAVMQALETVDADLTDGQRRFRAALATVELDAPNGPIRLDANRQAIGSTYLFEVTKNDAGLLSYRLLDTFENVDAGFGGHFDRGDPLPNRTQPPCRPGKVPAWAKG